MLRFIATVLLLLSAAVLYSQNRPQYLYTHLGLNNGLSSDETSGVQQDQKGFIWIATKNGLQRYDGQRLLTFRHSSSNPKSIPDDEILSIVMDKKNRLWMLCGENRVGYFNVSDFTFHEAGLPVPELVKRSKTISHIITDNAGNIIVVFTRNETLTYNEKMNFFLKDINPFKIPDNWKINSVYQDKLNNYWLACDSGLVKYNPVSKTISYKGHNTENDKVINALGKIENPATPYLDSKNRFWLHSWTFIGAGPFLYSYDLKNDKMIAWGDEIYRMLKSRYHEIYTIQEDKEGTLWVTGVNLMMSFNEAIGKFELTEPDLPGEYSIRFDDISTIFEDRENNLWVGTNKGVYRFNPTAQLFHTVKNKRYYKDSIYTPEVTDILQTQDGEILITTWGSGIFPYDKNFNAIKKDYAEQSMQAGEGAPWSIVQLKNGDIWRGHQGGWIFVFHADTKKTEKLVPPVFGGSTIRQLTLDSTGNLWFGTQRGYIVKWNAVSKQFSLMQQLKSIVNRLYTDANGFIWAATATNGVFRINSGNGAIQKHYTTEGPPGRKLSGNWANDIIQYNDSLYIIASAGLNILNIKRNTISYFNAESGLPSNIVKNIIKDRQGYLWMNTPSGICSFNMQNGLLNIYDAENGVQSNNFNLASSGMLHDGRIVFGTAHDVIVFNPADIIKENTIPPDVQITGFSLGNRPLSMDSISRLKEVELNYGQTSVVIEFSTLTYYSKYGISYMMEGIDKDWLSPGMVGHISFGYLPPGRHTLKVRAENGKGVYSKNITELYIHVRPPFWQTWWFYSLLALMAAGLFFWYDRERVRRLKTVQQMRSSIADNLHEEVNTALNNINVLSEIARIKADHHPEQSKDYIEEIHRQSHDMIISMDDMLWSIDPENDNMGKTIDRMREFADALQNRYDTVIVLQVEDEAFTLKPDMKTRHEFILIYKLALRLFVEQLHACKVNVQIDSTKSFLQLAVLSENKLKGENNVAVSKAITEMKTRAIAVNGKFDLQSDEKGTVITVELKS